MNEQLDLLDLLTIFSFILQIQNQNKLVGIQDIQQAVAELHQHLEEQDDKIDQILEVLNENYQKAVQDD